MGLSFQRDNFYLCFSKVASLLSANLKIILKGLQKKKYRDEGYEI